MDAVPCVHRYRDSVLAFGSGRRAVEGGAITAFVTVVGCTSLLYSCENEAKI